MLLHATKSEITVIIITIRTSAIYVNVVYIIIVYSGSIVFFLFYIFLWWQKLI